MSEDIATITAEIRNLAFAVRMGAWEATESMITWLYDAYFHFLRLYEKDQTIEAKYLATFSRKIFRDDVGGLSPDTLGCLLTICDDIKEFLDLEPGKEKLTANRAVVVGYYFAFWSIKIAFSVDNDADQFVDRAMKILRQFPSKPPELESTPNSAEPWLEECFNVWSAVRMIHAAIVRVLFVTYGKPITNAALRTSTDKLIKAAKKYYQRMKRFAHRLTDSSNDLAGCSPLVLMDSSIPSSPIESLLKVFQGNYSEAVAWKENDAWSSLWGLQRHLGRPVKLFGEEFSLTLKHLKDRLRLNAKLALGVYSYGLVGGLSENLGNEGVDFEVVELDEFPRGVLLVRRRVSKLSLRDKGNPRLDVRHISEVHVIFRGSDGIYAVDDWKVNLCALPWFGKIVVDGRVLVEANMHLGFYLRANALVEKIIREIQDIVAEEKVALQLEGQPYLKLVVCGHSQGAALATIIALCLHNYFNYAPTSSSQLSEAIILETFANPGAFYSWYSPQCFWRYYLAFGCCLPPCGHEWCTCCRSTRTWQFCLRSIGAWFVLWWTRVFCCCRLRSTNNDTGNIASSSLSSQDHPNSPAAPSPPSYLPSSFLDDVAIRHVNHNVDADAVPQFGRFASLMDTAHVTNVMNFTAAYDKRNRMSVVKSVEAHLPKTYQALAQKIFACGDEFTTITRIANLLVRPISTNSDGGNSNNNSYSSSCEGDVEGDEEEKEDNDSTDRSSLSHPLLSGSNTVRIPRQLRVVPLSTGSAYGIAPVEVATEERGRQQGENYTQYVAPLTEQSSSPEDIKVDDENERGDRIVDEDDGQDDDLSQFYGDNSEPTALQEPVFSTFPPFKIARRTIWNLWKVLWVSFYWIVVCNMGSIAICIASLAIFWFYVLAQKHT